MTAKILILEDDNSLQEIFTRTLHRAGHETVSAYNLAEGRRSLQEDTFDILLCDMRLPDGDGLTLLREFQDDLRAAGTRVVVVSAEPQYTSMSEELGVEFFLTKPISLQMLNTLLNRLLMQAASHD
ncbi:MAG: hypothetical protein Fur0018_12320 [Anaerolineales bacterium]